MILGGGSSGALPRIHSLSGSGVVDVIDNSTVHPLELNLFVYPIESIPELSLHEIKDQGIYENNDFLLSKNDWRRKRKRR